MSKLTRGQLRLQCEALEAELRRRGVPAADVLAQAPGSDDNPTRGSDAWLRFFAHLSFLSGQTERRPLEKREAAAQLREMQRREDWPFRVTVLTHAGAQVPVAIEKKNLEALLRWQVHDRVMQRIAGFQTENPESADPAFLARTSEAGQWQLRLMAWIAIAPGADIPPALRESTIDGPDTLPDDVAALSPIALVHLRQAFVQAHLLHFSALDALLSADPAKRASWSMFSGATAIETHEDYPAAFTRSDRVGQLLAHDSTGGRS